LGALLEIQAFRASLKQSLTFHVESFQHNCASKRPHADRTNPPVKQVTP
jgi:hypothetical protein